MIEFLQYSNHEKHLFEKLPKLQAPTTITSMENSNELTIRSLQTQR